MKEERSHSRNTGREQIFFKPEGSFPSGFSSEKGGDFL